MAIDIKCSMGDLICDVIYTVREKRSYDVGQIVPIMLGHFLIIYNPIF